MSNYKSEKQGGRMQCFMKKEDKILIDVEYVEANLFQTTVIYSLL